MNQFLLRVSALWPTHLDYERAQSWKTGQRPCRAVHLAQIGYESVDIKFVGFPDWPAQRLAVGRSQ